MGLFSKLKNILFEDDDEVEEMPVYTKEEVAEEQEEVVVEPVTQKVENIAEPTKLKNVKRDIDITFEDDDVLGEIPGAFDEEKEIVPQPEVVKEEVKEVEEVAPVEEKKSIFPSFDEAEFERLNARINQTRVKLLKEKLLEELMFQQLIVVLMLDKQIIISHLLM